MTLLKLSTAIPGYSVNVGQIQGALHRPNLFSYRTHANHSLVGLESSVHVDPQPHSIRHGSFG